MNCETPFMILFVEKLILWEGRSGQISFLFFLPALPYTFFTNKQRYVYTAQCITHRILHFIVNVECCVG